MGRGGVTEGNENKELKETMEWETRLGNEGNNGRHDRKRGRNILLHKII